MQPIARRRRSCTASSLASDYIRKFAGHNNLSTTMSYSRGSADAIVRVLAAKKKDEEE
jgi:hypothetical protein